MICKICKENLDETCFESYAVDEEKDALDDVCIECRQKEEEYEAQRFSKRADEDSENIKNNT